MSLAALRQRDRDVIPTLHAWFQEPDLPARLVHFDEPYLQGVGGPNTQSLVRSEAETIKSASSMTPALIHQSNASTHGPPSLYSGYTTEATPTETSVSTGLAHGHGHLAGYTLLEESHDGVLVVPEGHHRAPYYECAFWFLKCTYVSGDREQWEEHCLSHFRGEDPPSRVQCPLCDWTMESSESGQAAWTARMAHVANAHLVFGQTLRTSRPDFALFEYLWQKHLIDDQDLKELKAGNHNLTHPPGNFVEMGGRRRRGERMQRAPRQHVGMIARQQGPRQP